MSVLVATCPRNQIIPAIPIDYPGFSFVAPNPVLSSYHRRRFVSKSCATLCRVAVIVPTNRGQVLATGEVGARGRLVSCHNSLSCLRPFGPSRLDRTGTGRSRRWKSAVRAMKAGIVRVGSFGSPQQEGEVGVRPGGGEGSGGSQGRFPAGRSGRRSPGLCWCGIEGVRHAGRSGCYWRRAAPLRGNQHIVVQYGVGQPGLPDCVHRLSASQQLPAANDLRWCGRFAADPGIGRVVGPAPVGAVGRAGWLICPRGIVE